MSSGIAYPQEIEDTFQDFKMKKKHRYLSIQIVPKKDDTNNKTTEVFTIEDMPPKKAVDEDADACVEELMELLKDNKPRYVVFALSTKNIAGQLKENLYFVQYIPEQCPIKQKMIYGASADILKQRFSLPVVQLNDLSDCKEETFLSKKK